MKIMTIDGASAGTAAVDRPGSNVETIDPHQ
jgi:hypothetical protein